MTRITHIIIIAILALSSCQWWDNQIEALDCAGHFKEITCEDRVFYYCFTSLRWMKLESCNQIDKYIDYGIEYVNDYYDLEIELDFEDYVKCCEEI